MQMLDNDLIPRCLLLIVLATGLRCVDPDSVLPDRWAEECRHLVIPDIFCRASTTNLQTLLLLKQYEWHRGAHLSAWFVASLATRLATALQLEMEPSSNRSHAPPLPVTVMETRRRLIWGCFTMDSVPDGSTRPLRSALDPFSIEARLPCNERSYWLGIDTETDTLHNSKSYGSSALNAEPPSVLAYIIRMAVIRLQVLQYASTFSSRNKELLLPEIPWQVDSQFHIYRRQLEESMDNLPPEFRLDGSDKSRVTHSQPRSSLYTLHVMYHASFTDLLRVALFLDKAQIVLQEEPLPGGIGFRRQAVANFHRSTDFKTFLLSCRRSRLQHAFNITSIVERLLHDGPSNSHYLDPFVSVCTCVSIRVFALEREHGDAESLGISETTIQNALEVATTCVRKTARWSKPVQEMVSIVTNILPIETIPTKPLCLSSN
jgi:Fungal specific transcription factor domain